MSEKGLGMAVMREVVGVGEVEEEEKEEEERRKSSRHLAVYAVLLRFDTRFSSRRIACSLREKEKERRLG